VSEPAIEPAGPADLDAIVEIERHSFPTPWPRETFAAELSREGARLIVARVARGDGGARAAHGARPEAVVGFCNYWIVVDELHIHAIAAHPDHRRAGVGGRLLAHALAEARARGCVRATLEVRRGNAPAIALYQGAGFRGVHIRPRYYQDNQEDALIMLCELEPGA
jgi:ribosomal-protein-alanine N-acetyltransferase